MIKIFVFSKIFYQIIIKTTFKQTINSPCSFLLPYVITKYKTNILNIYQIQILFFLLNVKYFCKFVLNVFF